MKNVIILIVFVALAVTGCEKEDAAEPKTVTQLVTRTWKAYKYDIMADSKGVKNLYTLGSKTNVLPLDSYVLDLKGDGSFAETEVGSNGLLATQNGTWKLAADNKVLEMIYPGDAKFNYDIKSVDENEAIFEYSYQVAGRNPQDIQTFVKNYGVTPQNNYGFQLTVRP